MRRLLTALAVLGVLLGACSPNVGADHPQSEVNGADGVQATGRIAGQLVNISEGFPETNVVDCDPGVGADWDVCWITRSIDGTSIALVIENPGALVPGERLEVADLDCTACDDVTDRAVIELRVDGQPQRASGGSITPTRVEDRWAASFDLSFPNGDALRGAFNIRELAPGER